MSISSPEVQAKPTVDKTTVPESSSLLRWLILAASIMVIGVGGVALVRLLPSQTGSFLIPPKPKGGNPGRMLLTPDDPTYNFGVMPNQQKGTHTWTMKNTGLGDLILSKGSATCSCTIANFQEGKESFTLEPGNSTEITLTWETRESDGKFDKSATVNVVNDPDRDSVVFAISGIVKPAIAVFPKERSLEFGPIPSNESQTGKFAIASADRPDLKILGMTSTRPEEITLTSKSLTESDRSQLELSALKGGYQINVELKPSKILGRFSEEITVTTDHPLLKEIKVVVGGTRVGPVRIVPESVRFHNVYSEDGGSTSIILSVRNAPDTVFEVVQTPGNLKVEIIPSDVKTGTVAQVRLYKLVITVPPDSPSDVIEGTITLKSNHPDIRELKIPVYISILEGSATSASRSGRK